MGEEASSTSPMDKEGEGKRKKGGGKIKTLLSFSKGKGKKGGMKVNKKPPASSRQGGKRRKHSSIKRRG